MNIRTLKLSILFLVINCFSFSQESNIKKEIILDFLSKDFIEIEIEYFSESYKFHEINIISFKDNKIYIHSFQKDNFKLKDTSFVLSMKQTDFLSVFENKISTSKLEIASPIYAGSTGKIIFKSNNTNYEMENKREYSFLKEIAKL
jgi:hypothetical protein